jgi:hypothetical protein
MCFAIPACVKQPLRAIIDAASMEEFVCVCVYNMRVLEMGTEAMLVFRTDVLKKLELWNWIHNCHS